VIPIHALGKTKKDDSLGGFSSFFANAAGGEIALSTQCPEYLGETFRVEGVFDCSPCSLYLSLYFYTIKEHLSILGILFLV